MKRKLTRLLVILVAMAMIVPATGLAYAAPNDEAASAQPETAVGLPDEVGGVSDLDPANLHVKKLGDDQRLSSLKEKAEKNAKSESGEITLDEIEKMDASELNQTVRISIFMKDSPALDRFSMDQAAGTASRKYRSNLESKQKSVEKQINSALGRNIDVKWHLTLAVNAISTEATYSEIAKILKVSGVKRVEREKRYEALDDAKKADPDTSLTSTGMTGASQAWSAGYSGAGTKIAIIDTGIDVTHQSFDSDAFDEAIKEDKEVLGKTVDLLTEEKVNSLAEDLNIYDKLADDDELYISSKIPFGYNYVDSDTNVEHIYDTQGEHGSHVAGIAAANRLIKKAVEPAEGTEEEPQYEYVNAIDEVFAVGMAPDAQLVVMKVFGQGGGAYDSDYMAAIEDAIVLGCDSCNLSLGSGDPGFSYDTTYQDVFNKLNNADSGMVVSISAGNSYSWADNNNLFGYLFEDDVNYDTVGSPGSYINSLSVASAENIGTTGKPIIFDEYVRSYYTDGSGDMSLIANDTGYDYVYIDSLGNATDYAAVDEAVGLEGKIVIVNRGDITFAEKGNNLIPYKPAGLIIANNQPGTIGMALDDFTGDFPMVSITLDDAKYIKAVASHFEHKFTLEDEGIDYYTGNAVITKEVAATQTNELEYTEISDFSSWGIPGSLIMKPEITAPGGNIYSVAGTNQTPAGAIAGGFNKYELMSGTSMAAPHIAGLSAVLLQYIKETGANNLNSELAANYSTRAIAQSLLMSTAVPMQPYAEEGYNGYLPIIQQGSGLADVSKAINAGSVIMMKDAGLTTDTKAAQDGKVKVELGDDAARNGEYSYTFTIYNTNDVDEEFKLHTDMFTQDKDALTDEDEDIDLPMLLPYTRDLEAEVKYNGSDSNITVPAKGSKDVTVSIKITDESIDDYKNGAYIEGYTFVECITETAEGESLEHVHSIPILGFYGNWTDPSMFEKLSYNDVLEMEYADSFDPTAATYYDTYSYVDLNSYTGKYATNVMEIQIDGQDLIYTGNPYAIEKDVFESDRLAISSKTKIKDFYYTLIRPAGTLGYSVNKLDENGNISDTLSSRITGTRFPGVWYYVNGDEYYNTDARSAAVNNTVKDYALSENDRFHVGFYALPEYTAMMANKEGGDLTDSRSGVFNDESFKGIAGNAALGNGVSIGYDLTIDDTAPEIKKVVFSEEANEVTFTASDNQNLAYMAIMDVDGSYVYNDFVPAKAKKTVTLDVTRAMEYEGYVAIFAADYAGNETAVALKINDDNIVGHDVNKDGETNGDDAQAVLDYITGANDGSELDLEAGEMDGDDVLTSNDAYLILDWNPEPTRVSEVYLDKDTVNLFQGRSQSMIVNVLPITAEDKTIIWSSSDENVATVSEDGVITGVAPGTAVITAASIAEASEGNRPIESRCTVNVMYVEKELNGILYDKDSKEWFSHFNTKDLTEYSKDKESEAGGTLTVFNYYGTPIAGTLDTEEYSTSMFMVDPDADYSMSKLGDNYEFALDTAIGFTDFGTPLAYATVMTLNDGSYLPCIVMGNIQPNPRYNNMVGVPYVLGSFEDTIDDAWIIGLALKDEYQKSFDARTKAYYVDSYYEGSEEDFLADYPEGKYYAPSYYFLDDYGRIWSTDTSIELLYDEEYEEYYDDVIFSEPVLVSNTGVQTSYLYQSLYYDGEYIYWSHYDSIDASEVYVIDPENKDIYNNAFNAGDFGESIWPVSGLYEMNAIAGYPLTGNTGDRDVSVAPGKIFNYEILDKKLGELSTSKDSLKKILDENAKSLRVVSDKLEETDPVESDVEPTEPEAPAEEDFGDAYGVKVVEDEAAVNGYVTIKYDPEKLTFVGSSSNLTWRSINADEETGFVNLAYADKEEIETETLLGTVYFDRPCEDTDIVVTVTERGEELDLKKVIDEESFEGIEHVFGEWTVSKEPTCTESGIEQRVCQHNSNHIETREIPATGKHSMDDGTVTKAATCGEDGVKTFKCTVCGEILKTEVIPKTNEHKWDGGKVTKEATVTEEGVMTYTCTVCGTTKTEAIAKKTDGGSQPDSSTPANNEPANNEPANNEPGNTEPEKTDPAKQMGSDGTAFGEGASFEAANNAITSKVIDNADPKGTVFGKIQLRQAKVTNNSIKVKWTKVKNAKKYVIYANTCGKNKLKKVATKKTGTTYTLKKVNKKNLKKGKYYKFMVVALDKNNNVLSTSKIVHIATKGGRYTNAKSVTTKAKKNKVTIKKGKTFKLGAAVTLVSPKLKTKSHRKISYETSKKSVATVTTKGVIKANKKGTAYIYVYAQNGVFKKIKVTVK